MVFGSACCSAGWRLCRSIMFIWIYSALRDGKRKDSSARLRCKRKMPGLAAGLAHGCVPRRHRRTGVINREKHANYLFRSLHAAAATQADAKALATAS
jgi:hypothetical protein